jgi:hypothetical protein
MRSHQTALWAGVAAFFGSLLAIGIFDIFEPDRIYEYLGSIVVAFITGGAVYAKQRLDDAKLHTVDGGIMRITEVGDKRVFTLELTEEPVIFADKQEVMFRVVVNQLGEE